MSQKLGRTKCQCVDGSVLVWPLVLPSGLLNYRIVKDYLNPDKYIELLQTTGVPIMKLDYEDYFLLFIKHGKLQML